jgi:Rab-GTPase-TBC domain
MTGQGDDREAEADHVGGRRSSNVDNSESEHVSVRSSRNSMRAWSIYRLNLSSTDAANLQDTFKAGDKSTPSQNRTSLVNSRDLISNQRRSSSTNRASDVPHPPPETDTETNYNTQDTSQPKSPLLTSHRLSTISLDNVNLEDVPPDAHLSSSTKGTYDPRKLQAYIEPLVIAQVDLFLLDTSEKPPASKTSVASTIMGLSGALPSMPWSPPPPTPASSKHSNPAPATRKLTSPFSWLSRNIPMQKEIIVSPPLPPSTTRAPGGRRYTASSINTINSNPEMMLSKLEENNETDTMNGTKHPSRNSLKDRFKLLRMREEAGITNLGDGDHTGVAFTSSIGRGTSIGPASPGGIDDHSPVSPVPTSPHLAIVNNALAPGTASGASAGPSAMADASPVDWDLWQAVVYEGPAAVARTSPEELNRAIATGIPSAIRGVVWQVLAQSKNEELEGVYRELVARGTDKDKDRMSGSTGTSSVISSAGSVNGNNKEKEAVASSASSIHSDHSTLATNHGNGMRSPSPSQEKDMESVVKAQAAAVIEKKKKAKEDAASLQKLEKTIKRDLGARTSFSKFAASAGLQESLFGVCKAYALFDEGVGYAQGMNFLAMPLLFNVGCLVRH